MQGKKIQDSNYKMTLLPNMESLIPEDHRLRKLNRVLNLSFVREAVKDYYCPDNGRPSVDPEVLIRLLLLQSIERISSIRELMREVQVNLAYLWFIGYELGETLPDHSTLSKALDRFGDDVFDRLFKQSIALCHASGLVEGQVLHADATTIRADLDSNRVGKVDSPDPDARFGRFPDGRLRPGYKQHVVVDGRARVVVGMTVTPADRVEGKEVMKLIDQAVSHLGVTPEVVCGDAAYGSGRNKSMLDRRGIRLVSPPAKALTNVGKEYFTVEDFAYDCNKDAFTCPGGATLKYVGRDSLQPDRCHYRASRKDCRVCSHRGRCTRSSCRHLKVGENHAALIRLRADSRTKSFKELYRARAPVVEGVFAEEKSWHGLRRAWRRGLMKMRIQCALVAAVINFKRLITAGLTFLSSNRAYFYSVFSLIYQKINSIYDLLRHDGESCPVPS